MASTPYLDLGEVGGASLGLELLQDRCRQLRTLALPLQIHSRWQAQLETEGPRMTGC